VVNVGDFEKRFKGQTPVSPQVLREAGLAKKSKWVKVLGDGELSQALTIQAHAFSATAKKKIEKAGGKIEVLKK